MKKVNTLWSLLGVGLFIGGCGVSAGNGPSGNFRIATDTLPAAQISAPYTAAVEADGGTAPYSWSVRKGNWPQGIILNSSTGAIAGAPGQKGRFSITLGATDSSTPPNTTTTTLTLTVNSTQVAVTTTSLPSGAQNVAYSATLAADNGSAPYSWSVSGGKLPSGLTLQSSGTLSGTPTQAGTFSFTPEVTDSTNSTATASLSVTIAAPSSPVINSLSPSSGTTSGGTTVTIAGANFVSGASVTFGGSAAASVTVSSSSQIVAVAPGHVAGTVGVIVSENGQNSGSANFTYNALTPAVTSVSPNSGPTAGGTTVTINGSNFLAGALILFGTTPATNVSVVSATQIQAVTPANAAGPATVSVQDPGNLAGSLSGGFNYTSSQSGAPTISSVSPSSGAPGSQVTITGANFVSADTVSFGSTAATSSFVSSSQMTAVVPSVSSGTYGVTVTDPDPAAATLPNAFTVTASSPAPVGNQSLLSGCTYANTNGFTGGCDVPSGWTVVGQQDFECSNSHAVPANPACGQLPSGQWTFSGGANFETTQVHAGSYAYGGLYGGDDYVVAWVLSSIGSFSQVYISYWDYTDPDALFPNSDYTEAALLENNGTCGNAPAIGIGGQSPLTAASYSTATMVPFGTGDPSSGCPNAGAYSNGFGLSIDAGRWEQHELLIVPSTSYASPSQNPLPNCNNASSSTPGCGNGTLEFFVNGVLKSNMQNANLNGTASLQNASVQVGGFETSFSGNGSDNVRCVSWSSSGGGTCPGAQPGSGAPPPFHRYLDDIIVMKR